MQDSIKFDLNKSIFLMMDYQNGIVTRYDGADQLVDKAADVLSQLRGRAIQIGYVRVAFTESDYDKIPSTNKSFSLLTNRRDMLDSSSLTQIATAISPLPGDLVVRKTRVGAFSTTDLETQLKAKNINTLILAGIATSGVVLSTVREAADRDYKIVIISDLCADSDQAVQEVLMTKVFPRQADVLTKDQFLSQLNS